MPYTYVNLGTARAQLAQRLYDPDMKFWTSAELTGYIQEALRTWNSIAMFWKAEFLMDTSSVDTWYDITQVPNTLRPYTVTDVNLYQQMEYHLLEPATGYTWTGSLQFNINDLQNAVQRRRNEILSNTSCTVTRTTVAALVGRTLLPDNLIDLRRVAWLPITSPVGYKTTPLFPDDEFALESYGVDYTVKPGGSPTTYRQSTEPPLAFDVDTPPAVPGLYEVLSVNSGPALGSNPSLLYVPDDYTWVIKFGALADLLNRESNAKDELRAKYCNLRYQQGLAILRNAPAILAARIQNIPLSIEAAQSMDYYRPNWQNETPGIPDTLLIAGPNLIGFAVVPDAVYSVTLSVLQNAPVPTIDADYIQLGQDDYDVLLDYAQHLASFKMGGVEFMATMPLLQRFFTQAGYYSSKLENMGEYAKIMAELSQLQAQFNPVFSPGNDPMTAGQ